MLMIGSVVHFVLKLIKVCAYLIIDGHILF